MYGVTRLGWGCLDTPVGQVSVACTDAGVARVTYGPPAGTAPADGTSASLLLEAALEELGDYFAGRLTRFDVPVDLGSARGARRTVLSVLHGTVGFGQTITYGALAARADVGAPAGPSARVPGEPGAFVPPARVVAGAGLGGYSGGTGTDVKHWLLVFEGALPATLDWDPAGLRPRPAGARPG